MSRLDHARRNAADRARRQGQDDITETGIPAGLSPFRPRPSKSSQRQMLADAVAASTRQVSCRACGHSASIPIPAVRLASRLRCSRCGSTGTVEA